MKLRSCSCLQWSHAADLALPHKVLIALQKCDCTLGFMPCDSDLHMHFVQTLRVNSVSVCVPM
jgi:hypothetical protein